MDQRLFIDNLLNVPEALARIRYWNGVAAETGSCERQDNAHARVAILVKLLETKTPYQAKEVKQ